VVIAEETIVFAEAEPALDQEPSAPVDPAPEPVPDIVDAASEEQTDVAIVTETVIVIEDAPSAAPEPSEAPDLAGAPTGEEATVAESSSEPGAEERQESPPEA
jgi:hypothetical protein